MEGYTVKQLPVSFKGRQETVSPKLFKHVHYRPLLLCKLCMTWADKNTQLNARTIILKYVF